MLTTNLRLGAGEVAYLRLTPNHPEKRTPVPLVPGLTAQGQAMTMGVQTTMTSGVTGAAVTVAELDKDLNVLVSHAIKQQEAVSFTLKPKMMYLRVTSTNFAGQVSFDTMANLAVGEPPLHTVTIDGETWGVGY